MNWRRARWWIVGAICALTIFIGYRARPVDDLAAMMRFHPEIQPNGYMGGSPEERGGFVYKFKDRADAVAAAIPGFTGIGAGSDVAPFQLPGGRAAMFIVAPYPMSDGSTCELLVWD